VDELCPEKSNVIKTITLGTNTVARRIGDMSTNLMEQIASHAKNFLHFSLAMDESTDMCGTSQLLIFIRCHLQFHFNGTNVTQGGVHVSITSDVKERIKNLNFYENV